MSIVAVDIFRLRLPFRQAFATSYGTLGFKETLLLRLTSSGGVVGWGEAPAFQDGFSRYETISTVLTALQKSAPRLLESPSGPMNTPELLASKYAQMAFEGAFLDLRAQASGESLSAAWARRKKIAARVAVGGETTGDLLAEVERAVAYGATHVKLKIRRGFDREPVLAVLSRYSDLDVSVDANGAYGPEHLTLMADLAHLGLSLIEQPFSPADLPTHAELQQRIDIPVALDESISTVQDVAVVAERAIAWAVNIKPASLGGYAKAIEALEVCRQTGLDAVCGGMFESGAGKALNVHLASHGGFTLAADISPTGLLFERDVLQNPIEVADGMIEIPKLPGTGFPIDQAAVDALTIDSKSFG